MKLVNKLRASVLKRFYIFTNGGYSVGSAYGCRFLLDWKHPIDKKMKVGLYENDSLKLMLKLINQHKPRLFIDIGSHSGFYSIIAKKNLPDCEVHAFEPDKENLCQLQANLFLNKFCDDITVYAHGLSNFSGEVLFDRSTNTSRATRAISEQGNHKIQVDLLDNVITAKGETAFLKIDVEGHESQVLDGAKNLLNDNKCMLQIEIFPENLEKIEEKLSHFGYKKLKTTNMFDHYFSNAPLDQE